MPLAVGDMVGKRGFFTKAVFLRGIGTAEIERRVGYRAGRLSDGWYLLFMASLPSAHEFEVRGYSQMSGGVAQGHVANPPDLRNSEQILRDGGHDLLRIKGGSSLACSGSPGRNAWQKWCRRAASSAPKTTRQALEFRNGRW